MARHESSGPRVLGRREQRPDGIERLQVRHRVGPRSTSDRRLVHEHDIGDELDALDPAKLADPPIPVLLGPLDRRIEHVVHQRRLSGPADTGHARERVERNLDVDVLQVVFRGAEQSDFLPHAPSTRGWHRNRQFIAQILRRERLRLPQQTRQVAGVHHSTALLARAQSDVDDVVGHADHVLVVLDHDDGVSLVAQLPEDVDQSLIVSCVQTDGRLVQHVERPHQRRPERRGQIDPL